MEHRYYFFFAYSIEIKSNLLALRPVFDSTSRSLIFFYLMEFAYESLLPVITLHFIILDILEK